MKKGIIVSLLVAGGATAYYFLKKAEENYEEPEEVKFLSIDDDEDGEEEEASEDDEEPSPIEQYTDEVKEIGLLYPYLPLEFIRNIFLRNEEFNEKYPENTLIVLTHVCSFEDSDARAKFEIILADNGYTVDEVGNTVRVSKKFFTENGRIVSDIFNVANQCNCLDGDYTKYIIKA